MENLNVKISYFADCNKPEHPDNRGTFYGLITSPKLLKRYGPLLDIIRATDDPEKRKKLKKQLPAFTPSGVFSYRSEEGFISHSGLLSFDLDAQANPFLNAGTVEPVKREIAKLPEVAFCQISAGGNGLWGIVPMAFPDRHKEQFEALEIAFALMGFRIDPACKDVCRLRFWSYDPAPYFNPDAQTFTGLPKPKTARPIYAYRDTALPDDLATQAAEYLRREKKVVAFGYDDYFKIVTACKNSFGDNGESIAWEILENSPCFTVSNFRKDFAKKWKGAGTKVTAGTLVHLAKEAGFRYSSDAHTTAPQVAPRSTQAPAPGKIIETFTSQFTGQAIEREINEHGYPAMIDEPAPPTASRLEIAQPIVMANEGLAMGFEGVLPDDLEAWTIIHNRTLARPGLAEEIERQRQTQINSQTQTTTQ